MSTSPLPQPPTPADPADEPAPRVDLPVELPPHRPFLPGSAGGRRVRVNLRCEQPVVVVIDDAGHAATVEGCHHDLASERVAVALGGAWPSCLTAVLAVTQALHHRAFRQRQLLPLAGWFDDADTWVVDWADGPGYSYRLSNAPSIDPRLPYGLELAMLAEVLRGPARRTSRQPCVNHVDLDVLHAACSAVDTALGSLGRRPAVRAGYPVVLPRASRAWLWSWGVGPEDATWWHERGLLRRPPRGRPELVLHQLPGLPRPPRPAVAAGPCGQA